MNIFVMFFVYLLFIFIKFSLDLYLNKFVSKNDTETHDNYFNNILIYLSLLLILLGFNLNYFVEYKTKPWTSLFFALLCLYTLSVILFIGFKKSKSINNIKDENDIIENYNNFVLTSFKYTRLYIFTFIILLSVYNIMGSLTPEIIQKIAAKINININKNAVLNNNSSSESK